MDDSLFAVSENGEPQQGVTSAMLQNMRRELKQQQKRVTRMIRNEERKRQRLLDRAAGMSNDILMQAVIEHSSQASERG